MRLTRRQACGALVVVGAGALVQRSLVDPEDAEALSALRAKIVWSSILPRSLSERPAGDDSAYALWRDNTITRQSNPDVSREQVLTSKQFVDVVQFIPSLDIALATIRVHQPIFGAARTVHVKIAALGKGPDTRLDVDPTSPDEPALLAGQPVEVTIYSQIPAESQAPSQRPTARVFTSIIRVGERTTDNPLAIRNLNKALIVRTELQGAAWATANGRPTPTPIGQR